MSRSTPSNQSSCLLASLLVVAMYLVALGGLTAGLVALAGKIDPVAITVMNISVTPLLIYLLLAGAKDLGKQAGKGRWFKLGTAGVLFALMLGINSYQALYMGTCTRRLLPGGRLTGCDLSRQDLSGRDLHEADLAFADLSGANLTGADLSGAHFDDTDLSEIIGMDDATLARFLSVSVEALPAATAKYAIHLEKRADLQAALAAACQGQAVSGARLNPDYDSFHTVMVLDSQGEHSSAWDSVSQYKRWEPMALRFTDLVACVAEQEKIRLNTCQYTGGHSISRFRYQVEIQLFNAASGELVDQRTLQGGQPDSCPSSTSGGQGAINGSKVSSSNISDWLATWVHPEP